MKYKVIYGFSSYNEEKEETRTFEVDEIIKVDEINGDYFCDGFYIQAENIEKIPFPYVQVVFGSLSLVVVVVVLFIILKKRR